jgi:hypothetical protein
VLKAELHHEAIYHEHQKVALPLVIRAPNDTELHSKIPFHGFRVFLGPMNRIWQDLFGFGEVHLETKHSNDGQHAVRSPFRSLQFSLPPNCEPREENRALDLIIAMG